MMMMRLERHLMNNDTHDDIDGKIKTIKLDVVYTLVYLSSPLIYHICMHTLIGPVHSI